MSVVTEQIIAPKNVQILIEVSFVDVTLGFRKYTNYNTLYTRAISDL